MSCFNDICTPPVYKYSQITNRSFDLIEDKNNCVFWPKDESYLNRCKSVHFKIQPHKYVLSDLRLSISLDCSKFSTKLIDGWHTRKLHEISNMPLTKETRLFLCCRVIQIQEKAFIITEYINCEYSSRFPSRFQNACSPLNYTYVFLFLKEAWDNIHIFFFQYNHAKDLLLICFFRQSSSS